MIEPRKEERSLPDLFSGLIRDLTELLRKEIALAKAEASEKLRQLGTGIAALAIGALLAFAGLLVLLDALVLKLSDRMSPALAALIVGGIVAAIGIFLLLKGKNNLSAGNLTPARTTESIRRDAEMVREHIS